MQIGTKQKRTLFTTWVAGFIFNFFVALIISLAIGEGVFFSLIILAAIYGAAVFMWLKKSVFEWLMYYWKGKKIQSSFILSFLKDNGFPEPDEYVSGVTDYFEQVMDNKDNPADLRVAAAIMAATGSSVFLSGGVQGVARYVMAGESAIEDYKSFCETKPPTSPESPE